MVWTGRFAILQLPDCSCYFFVCYWVQAYVKIWYVWVQSRVISLVLDSLAQTILAKSIANNDTNTFSKSIGDTFTSILLSILWISLVTSLHENVLLLRHFWYNEFPFLTDCCCLSLYEQKNYWSRETEWFFTNIFWLFQQSVHQTSQRFITTINRSYCRSSSCVWNLKHMHLRQILKGRLTTASWKLAGCVGCKRFKTATVSCDGITITHHCML